MIRISRDDKVPARLTNAPATGDYFNHPTVRDKLWRMQKTKCCYCERHIPRTGAGAHVEHFRPKERPEFAGQRNDWNNLLLACSDCNGNKGETFPMRSGRPLLLDPSSTRLNPEDHITFTTGEHEYEVPGLAEVNNRSPRGRETIEVIRLWERPYVRARTKHFQTRLGPAAVELDKAIESGDVGKISEAKRKFEELLADSAEFAAFARSLARNRHLEDQGVSIP